MMAEHGTPSCSPSPLGGGNKHGEINTREAFDLVHLLVHVVRGSRSPRTQSDCVGGVVYDLSRDHRSRVCLGSLLIAVSAPRGDSTPT